MFSASSRKPVASATIIQFATSPYVYGTIMVMKRYRVLGVDFDFNPSLLTLEIKDHWEPEIKKLHHQNKAQIRQELLSQFGADDIESKIQNYIDLGSKPISVLAFHNTFLEQIRRSFVIGSYYPALTGTCALGERILNHLLLKLRNYYKTAPEYKKIYLKQSFDNWDIPINTLSTWNVLLPDVAENYRTLRDIRNTAIHFNPATDQNDRSLALDAYQTLSKIIAEQFSGFGAQPWFIPHTPGAAFLKKEVEQQPFIQEVLIPNSVLVGPFHRIKPVLEKAIYQFIVKDDYKYEDKEIADEEFAELYRNINH